MAAEKEPSTPLGALVREHRKRKGWNQTELGEHLGISKSTAADLETGPERKVPMERYIALERVFGVPIVVWMQKSTATQIGIFTINPEDMPALVQQIAAGSMELPEAEQLEVYDYVQFLQQRVEARSKSGPPPSD